MRDKVVFLDRDGVINRDSSDFIKTVAEFEFLPRSLDALSLLTKNGFRVILITNQSVIGRGMASPAALTAIHRHLTETVEKHGGRIQDIFFCPHVPEDRCECRKPKPGLIRQAQRRYAISLRDAVMVGDSVKDIECARAAGCGAAVLVRTGNGESAAEIIQEKGMSIDYLAQDLYDAVLWILSATRDGRTK